MPRKKLNIIEFIREFNLLQGVELSPAQATMLRGTYGLELNQAEFEIYCRATGRNTYQPREQLEVTVIVGRQGGKTSRIGALCAVYESFRDHGLRSGERAYIYLIAPVTDQARIAFRFIRDYIFASPVLNKKVKKSARAKLIWITALRSDVAPAHKSLFGALGSWPPFSTRSVFGATR
jgi:phage terminase large subunit-like protein